MNSDVFKYLLANVHHADLIQNSRHCAAIVHKNEVLSIGWNKKKTHPMQKKYSSRPDRLFVHAEIDAITKIKDKSILKDCDIYVLRLSKSDLISNSKPCPGCNNAIRDYGFKNVYWTTDDNKDWL
jgi:tRNA(Arg) A34 adenosine deaminase TadA